MGEVLQSWFMQRLGQFHDMTPEIFGQHCQDGQLIAEILYSYNIIGAAELESIQPSAYCYSASYANLQQIKQWFQFFNFTCEDKLLAEIADGNGHAAMKLFYDLLLVLQDKSKLSYLTAQRINEKCYPSEMRFEVTRVSEVKPVAPEEPDGPLALPLIEHRDIIEWHKERYKALVDRYREVRERYLQQYRDKAMPSPDAEDRSFKTPVQKDRVQKDRVQEEDDLNARAQEMEDVDMTYEQLLEEQLRVSNMEPCKENRADARKFIKSLKEKKKRLDAEVYLKRHIQNMILSDLWDKIIHEEQREFSKKMSEKLLKQSDYEKQIAAKLLEIRYQKDVFANNRANAQHLHKLARETQFAEQIYFNAQHKCDEKSGYYFERDRALHLHRKLYAEKQRLKHERNFAACEDVVSDIADVAIQHSEYVKEFDVEPSRKQRKVWSDLFVAMQPIFEIVQDKTRIVQRPPDGEEIEEIVHLEIVRQDAVDKQNFLDYLECNWPWILEDLLQDFEEDLAPLEAGLNVLGTRYNINIYKLGRNYLINQLI